MMELLAELLRERKRRTLSDRKSTRCAVLVPIILGDGEPELLYTLRSEGLPSHKGQVAFPGGKHSPGDPSLEHTALREAQEEVDLDPADVEIIGCLDDVYTLSAKYHITPFVGLVRGVREFTPNPHEVTDIFTVTLSDLLDASYHGTAPRHWDGNRYQVDVITAGKHEIWGVTHSITMNFIECIEQAGMARKAV